MIHLDGLVTLGTYEAWDLRSADNVYRYAIGRAWDPLQERHAVRLMAQDGARAIESIATYISRQFDPGGMQRNPNCIAADIRAGKWRKP